MNFKISIIIPFFNSSKNVIGSDEYFSLFAFEKCLSAIFKSRYKKYEVIAVSDSSNQQSINIAKKYSCKIVKLKKNSGSGYARNKGASLATGQILLFLDSDVEVKEDALEIINERYKSNKDIALQGVYSHEPNYKSHTTQYFQSYFCYHLFSTTKKHKYTETLCTNIFSIKKNVFFKLGGFFFKTTNASSEDSELGFKLIKNGYKIPIERKLNTIHNTNFGLWSGIKRIVRIHTGEMKMYLRNKTILMKARQSNYYSVIFGIILISSILALLIGNYFYPVLYFFNILFFLNLLFISIHFEFLKFIYFSKGLLSACRAIIYSYLHGFLFVYCICFGIIDFYFFRNKY